MPTNNRSFEELLASVAQAHEREVQLLRTEIDDLRTELALAQAKGDGTLTALLAEASPKVAPPPLELGRAQASAPHAAAAELSLEPVDASVGGGSRPARSQTGGALTILLPGCVGDSPTMPSPKAQASTPSQPRCSLGIPECARSPSGKAPAVPIQIRKASSFDLEKHTSHRRRSSVELRTDGRRESKSRSLPEGHQRKTLPEQPRRTSLQSIASDASAAEEKSEGSQDTAAPNQTANRDSLAAGARRRGTSFLTPGHVGNDADASPRSLRRPSTGAESAGSKHSRGHQLNRGHRTSIAESVCTVMQSLMKELDGNIKSAVIDSGALELAPVWSELQSAALEQTNSGRFSVVPSGTQHWQRRSRQPSIVDLVENARRRNLNNFLRSFVLAPSSRIRLAWDIAGLLLLLFDMIVVPLQFFPAVAETDFVGGVQLVTTCFWTLDIIASFFVGYHCKGTVVVDPLLIAHRYLKSWFFFDLVISSLDWTLQVLASMGQAVVLNRVLRVIRTVRLLRVAKLQTLLSEVTIKVKIKSELTRTLLGILKIICVILILNHFIACGFYGLHYAMEDGQNWVKNNFQPHHGSPYRYWTSVHWSLTQFTPASMEVVPVNTLERCYAVCALLLALICFSSFVSSITSAMTRFGSSNLRQQQQTAALYRFLGQHSISTELVNRVWHYLHDRKVMASQARTREEDVELVAILPDSIKIELRYEMFMPTLVGHPFLREYSNLEPQAIRHICKSAVKEHTLSIREELFGDCVDVTHMVFVTDGMLTYSYPENEEDKEGDWAQAQISKGQWACEAALWASSLSLVGPFVAATSCELLLVSVAEFIVVARRFPNTVGLIAEYAENFIGHAKEESKDCRWTGSLCHSPEAIQDLVHKAVDDHHIQMSFHQMGRDIDDGFHPGARQSFHSCGSTSSSGDTTSPRGTKKGSLWSMWTGKRSMAARDSPKNLSHSQTGLF